MNKSWKIHRRTVLKGLGACLALPCLDAMGDNELNKQQNLKRACFIYSGNGVSLPPQNNPAHKEWHWFPHETGSDYKFTQPLMPYKSLKDKISIVGGLHHPNAAKADIHVCSDLWMTGAMLGGASYNNTISADQLIAAKYRSETRFPFMALSCDGGVGFKSRIGTISFDRNGRPIPSENDPRRIFARMFKQGQGSVSSQRKKLKYNAKVVDMVLENAKSLNQRLGKNDREKMDQYLTSVNDIEDSITRNSKWLDTPVKNINTDRLVLDVDKNIKPDEYYDTMFNLIALAFEADLTRVATFMMTREDGMGIADTFSTIMLGLSGHHGLSHGGNKKDGYKNWAKYDQFLSARIAKFLSRLDSVKEGNDSMLDNSLVLHGSGCSSTHNFKNLPALLAGGKNMGVKHGSHHNYNDKLPMNNMHYSILKAVGVKRSAFGDSTGILAEIFS